MPVEGRILVVTALDWEARAVRRAVGEFRIAEAPAPSVRARLWRGTGKAAGVWVLRSGIGRVRMLRALDWAGDLVRPGILLATGCAGGLGLDLAVGQLVVADEIVLFGSGATYRSERSLAEAYSRAAASARVPWRSARLLTSDGLILGFYAKSKAGSETGAAAVDMETTAAAEWAARSAVGFAAARVVLDSLTVQTPAEIEKMTGESGRPLAGRVLLAILRKPSLIPQLYSLASARRRCERALTRVHRELFAALGSKTGGCQLPVGPVDKPDQMVKG